MVYSPALSEKSSHAIKCLSYAFNLPMTKTIEKAISLLPLIIHPVLVCQKCKEQSGCPSCVFNTQAIPEDIKKLMPSQK
ncbi:hypothetical protein AGMMS49928_21050 [Spirochaetia bacterium]|nr:hypothetical protein AGMMS49928_21050 [Spirochaetia bacterium]